MRTTLLVCLCLCAAFCCPAQKQANLWYFGNMTGLDFNTSPPTVVSGRTGFYHSGYQEGASVISNASGKLLFYTDGERIYNRLHDTMLNGNFIGGHFSSTQSSIIIPKPGPGNTSLFYVFTSDAEELHNPIRRRPIGYNYSVVDMCQGIKDKDTLGAVPAGMKNIHLVDSGTEKLCAAADAAGGYWVLGHKVYSNEFLAWHVTTSGISAPVRTRIGAVMGNVVGNDFCCGYGQMKFNAAGTKVAAVSGNRAGTSASLELYDFNPATGKLSNHCAIPLGSPMLMPENFTYGVEFSPDGSTVFATIIEDFVGYVLKFSLNGSCPAITGSRDTLFARPRTHIYIGGMQAAPDGKIYICYDDALQSKMELHTISFPNGTPRYDTGLFTRPMPNVSVQPPKTLTSFVAGFKYHNIVPCAKPAGMPESSSADDIRIVPNPADGFVTITVDDQAALQNMQLRITDAMGRTVYEGGKLPVRIDMSPQPAGIYYYQINDAGAFRKSGRFTVVH